MCFSTSRRNPGSLDSFLPIPRTVGWTTATPERDTSTGRRGFACVSWLMAPSAGPSSCCCRLSAGMTGMLPCLEPHPCFETFLLKPISNSRQSPCLHLPGVGNRGYYWDDRYETLLFLGPLYSSVKRHRLTKSISSTEICSQPGQGGALPWVEFFE